MQYPLISEYVRAMQNAGDNLGELVHLVPVLDNHGEPYRSSGAFAVVFKMKDEQTGKVYALKCFTEEQEGRAEAYRQIADELECVDSSYLTSVKYLEKELFVDSDCEEEEFPVLLMDWVDGETMETYIAANYQDEYAMAMLCYRFCKMAAWLRSQPFAHGDIKPDNIMVRPDGSLTLVDYDGMFVPAMKGKKSPTVGTKDFSHPLRTINDFDETIDDFALATIALSLKAISLKPSLLDEYGASDRLLFSADDYLDLRKSKVVVALQELMNDEEVKTLFSMFLLASAKNNLALCSFRLFIVRKPKSKTEVLSTEVTEEDLKNAIQDEYGVMYSKDGKRLLKAFLCESESTYVIEEGTRIICDSAFEMKGFLENIIIPNGVTSIGRYAFCGCRLLLHLVIPDSVTNIGKYAFQECINLSNLIIPNGVTSIGEGVFCDCDSLSDLVIPNSIMLMEGNPFYRWIGDLQVLSPNFIYDDEVLYDVDRKTIIAFRRDVDEYVIPDSVISIGDGAFADCSSLVSVVIPNSVISIGDGAFADCSSLVSVVIPNSVTGIGYSAFEDCRSLTNIVLPDSVASIGDSAFSGCRSLKSIVIPNGVTSIGDYVFSGCSHLESIVIPDSVTSIRYSAFSGCSHLESIVIPSSVTSIGNSAFSECIHLESIVIPSSVTSIGNKAFAYCINLESIVIPSSVTSIGDGAFYGCRSLPKLIMNEIISRFGENMFTSFGEKMSDDWLAPLDWLL